MQRRHGSENCVRSAEFVAIDKHQQLQLRRLVGCFCVLTGPVKVEVVGGHVARVTVIATGAQLTGYSTIDELFDQIRSATPALIVEFDRSLGYPTRIERCCLEDDSGSVTTISSLIPSS
jgi:hypothetical protein